MSSTGMGTPKAQRRIHPTFPACSLVRFSELIISCLLAALIEQMEHQTHRVSNQWHVGLQGQLQAVGITSQKCSLFLVFGALWMKGNGDGWLQRFHPPVSSAHRLHLIGECEGE
jgi:hypothetical protein